MKKTESPYAKKTANPDELFKQHAKSLSEPNNVSLPERELIRTQYGFDPHSTSKVSKNAGDDAYTFQQFDVNASLKELEKNDAISQVSHATWAKNEKAKGLTVAGKNGGFSAKSQKDEIVLDASGTPCRKVITSIELAHVRNDHAVPIAVKFSGFPCLSETLHPYSSEPCDLFLEPLTPYTPIKGRVLFDVESTHLRHPQAIDSVVKEWGPVTQERIQASYGSNGIPGVNYEIVADSFLEKMLHQPEIAPLLKQGENYYAVREPSGEIKSHHINAKMHDQLLANINQVTENIPFFDNSKISVKYSRADGRNWTNTTLGNGAVISELTSKSSDFDPHSETRGFGVSLKINYKFLPIT